MLPSTELGRRWKPLFMSRIIVSNFVLAPPETGCGMDHNSVKVSRCVWFRRAKWPLKADINSFSWCEHVAGVPVSHGALPLTTRAGISLCVFERGQCASCNERCDVSTCSSECLSEQMCTEAHSTEARTKSTLALCTLCALMFKQSKPEVKTYSICSQHVRSNQVCVEWTELIESSILTHGAFKCLQRSTLNNYF